MIRSTMIFALLFSFASASWADERTQKPSRHDKAYSKSSLSTSDP